MSVYPEEASLEDHLLEIKQLVDTYQPTRLVVDSLTALERAGSEQAYREFIVGLSSYAKQRELTTLLTASTPGLSGDATLTQAHVSTLADMVVLLRYAEQEGRIGRALTVLKMRGSVHDRGVREMTIAYDGITIGEPVTSTGVVSGMPG